MNVTAMQVVEQDANQDKKAKRGGEVIELQKKKNPRESQRRLLVSRSRRKMTLATVTLHGSRRATLQSLEGGSPSLSSCQRGH